MGDIADEMIDRYGWDEDDDDPEILPATCNRCGKKNLFWEEVEEGWRLWEGDKIHVCDVAKMFNIIEEQ